MGRLGPVDHFLLMIDRAARRSGLPGNLSAISLALDGALAAARVRRALAPIVERIPGLHARLSLVPVLGWSRWRIRPDADPGSVVEETAAPADGAAAAVAAALNAPLDPTRDPPVSMRLAPSAGGGTVATLRWFHPLADARGMDRLLSAIDEADGGSAPRLDGPDPVAAARSARSFLGRFRACRRARLAIDGTGPGPVLLSTRGVAPGGFGVLPFSLSPEESVEEERASRESFGSAAGNEHLVLATLRAAHRFQVRRGGPRGPYAIPVTLNLRRADAHGPVLGNLLTFLHLRATGAEAETAASAARAIRTSGVSLLGAGADRDVLALLDAGRWLPLRRYERERFRPDGAPRESIWFSNSGEILEGRPRWLGLPVREVSVATAVPHPPGVMLLFFRRDRRLHGSVVWAEGPFTRDDAFRLAEFAREELVARAPSPRAREGAAG